MKFKVSLRWGEERIKGFSDPIRTAEEVNDWTWWVLFWGRDSHGNPGNIENIG